MNGKPTKASRRVARPAAEEVPQNRRAESLKYESIHLPLSSPVGRRNDPPPTPPALPEASTVSQEE